MSFVTLELRTGPNLLSTLCVLRLGKNRFTFKIETTLFNSLLRSGFFLVNFLAFFKKGPEKFRLNSLFIRFNDFIKIYFSISFNSHKITPLHCLQPLFY